MNSNDRQGDSIWDSARVSTHRLTQDARNSTTDRSTLRVNLDHEDFHSSHQVGYEIGRICNEMRFSMQVGWAGLQHHARSPASLLARVKTLSMNLPQSQEILHFVSSVESRYDKWEILSGCEHQHDAILELHNFLINSESHDDVLRARFFDRMDDLDRLMPTIKTMLPSLNFNHGEFVQAGFLADQVINPPLKYIAAQIVISEGTDACNFSIDLPIERDDQGQVSQSGPTQLVNFETAILVKKPWAIDVLWPQVRVALTQIQVDTLRQSVRNEQLFDNDELASGLLDLVDSIVRGEHPLGDKATRLGLRLIANHKRIERTGYDVPAILTKHQFRLVAYLLDAEQDAVPKEKLRNKWELLGGLANPTDDAMATAKSKLNRDLSSLNLEIDTVGIENSWRLIDMSAAH